MWRVYHTTGDVKASEMISGVGLRAKEFCWTTMRAVGLGRYNEARNRHELYARVGEQLRPVIRALYACPVWIAQKRRLRFIDPEPWILQAVGHLAVDLDAYIKDNILAGRDVKPVLLVRHRPANEALLAHWSKHVTFIHNPLLCALLRPFCQYPSLKDTLHQYCSVMRGASRTYDVETRWDRRPPLLRLRDAEIARGEATLRLLGIPKGAWFVCIHVRESGYTLSSDWAHSYRNARIENTIGAIEAIVARGGWCVRVGDPTMRALTPTPNVIDYANSHLKTDWMDVFLCARCRFFLGSSSGLFGLAGVFGRPSALANVAPLACTYSFFPSDLAIPKRLIDADGQSISFPQAFATEASDYRLTSEFIGNGLTPVDNTRDEITDLAIEMLERIEGTFKPTSADEARQDQFRALLLPRHYCWHASSAIGSAFLQTHEALLRQESNFDMADELVRRSPNACERSSSGSTVRSV